MKRGAPIWKRLAFCIGLLLLGSFSIRAADPVVLDFESLAGTGNIYLQVGLIYREKGFVLADVTGIWGLVSFRSNYTSFNGSTALFNNTTDGYTSLTRSNAAPFDFKSIDLSKVGPASGGTVTFYGYRGMTLVASASVGVYNNSVQTYTFANLNNVTEVQWKQSYPSYQFDNVKAVPLDVAPQSEHLAYSTAGGSYLAVEAEYLQVGQNYVLQKSPDLVNWTDWKNFQPRSTFYTAGEPFPIRTTNAFFRVVRPSN